MLASAARARRGRPDVTFDTVEDDPAQLEETATAVVRGAGGAASGPDLTLRRQSAQEAWTYSLAQQRKPPANKTAGGETHHLSFHSSSSSSAIRADIAKSSQGCRVLLIF